MLLMLMKMVIMFFGLKLLLDRWVLILVCMLVILLLRVVYMMFCGSVMKLVLYCG